MQDLLTQNMNGNGLGILNGLARLLLPAETIQVAM